jgi:hypothetical protein
VDDPKAAKLFELIRSQQVLLFDMHLDLQALVDCLSMLPDFHQNFEDRKEQLRKEFHEANETVLQDIDAVIRAMKKSNGGS